MANEVKLCECGCGKPVSLTNQNNKNRGYVKGEPKRFVKGHHIVVSREAAPLPPDESSAYIPLTKGKFALVDITDYEWLSKWNWFVNAGYAARWDYPSGKQTMVLMHRAILGTEEGITTDHVNRNPLDNRRSNLRPATMRENLINRPSARTQGFRGVSKSYNRWRARIDSHGNRYNLGSFDSPEKAARAYDRAARIHHGIFAELNFPEGA